MKRYQSNFLAATDVGYFALKQPLFKRSSSRIYKLGNGQVILNAHTIQERFEMSGEMFVV